MKKLILLLITAALLSGCVRAGGFQAADTDSGRLQIITTVFPLYDFARNITGDKADVSMMLPLNADSHSYEPSPRDIINVRECDVFLYIGGASDEWAEKLSLGERGVSALRLFDSVPALETEHNHSPADMYDEHIWTSPRNAVLMVQAIRGVLIAADPENAQYYRDNADEYTKKLEELDALFNDITSNAVRNTVIFADRFAFIYLCEEYGLEYHAAFSSCSEHAEPDARTLSFLIGKIQSEKIPAVFHGELSDTKTAGMISREAGAEVEILLLHSVHTITQNEFSNNLGYIEIMQLNAKNLERALS